MARYLLLAVLQYGHGLFGSQVCTVLQHHVHYHYSVCTVYYSVCTLYYSVCTLYYSVCTLWTIVYVHYTIVYVHYTISV